MNTQNDSAFISISENEPCNNQPGWLLIIFSTHVKIHLPAQFPASNNVKTYLRLKTTHVLTLFNV